MVFAEHFKFSVFLVRKTKIRQNMNISVVFILYTFSKI